MLSPTEIQTVPPLALGIHSDTEEYFKENTKIKFLNRTKKLIFMLLSFLNLVPKKAHALTCISSKSFFYHSLCSCRLPNENTFLVMWDQEINYSYPLLLLDGGIESASFFRTDWMLGNAPHTCSV